RCGVEVGAALEHVDADRVPLESLRVAGQRRVDQIAQKSAHLGRGGKIVRREDRLYLAFDGGTVGGHNPWIRWNFRMRSTVCEEPDRPEKPLETNAFFSVARGRVTVNYGDI